MKSVDGDIENDYSANPSDEAFFKLIRKSGS